MKNRIRYALPALVFIAACNESTAPDARDLTIREARPVSPPPPPPAAYSISVVALGTLANSFKRGGQGGTGMGLNNGINRGATAVAGYTPYGSTTQYPFYWTLASGIVPLTSPAPTGGGWGNGVSDGGTVVGTIGIGGTNRAFVTTPSGPMTFLPTPAGAAYAEAYDITADGTCISGTVTIGSASSAVLWRNGAMETITSGYANAVSSDCGTVVGTSSERATVWRWNGTTWLAEVLPTVGTSSRVSSAANDISPNGEYIAGQRKDSVVTYAVVWHRENGAWIATDMPGSSAFANGIANSGNAVGVNDKQEPIIWPRLSDGSYSWQLLPSLDRSTSGWAAKINELGQISGRGQTRSGSQPVLWTIN